MVWSLRTVTSCRSDLLTPVTPHLNRVKLNVHHFCQIRNLLSLVFGAEGSSNRDHLCDSLSHLLLVKEPFPVVLESPKDVSHDSCCRKDISTDVSSRPATSPSRPAHLHTPRQFAAPGWVSLLSGRLCQHLLFCSCHVEPVLGQLQAPIWRQEAARMLDEGAACDSCQEQLAFS